MPCRLHVDTQLAVGQRVALPPDQGHYLRNVMRLIAGEHVILFNGRGGEYLARLATASREETACEVLEYRDVDRELDCSIYLIQAACRSEKIDTVLQKGTELGAAGFRIVRSERSSLKLDERRREKRMQRWRRIIVEAAEQSGRTLVPTLAWHDGIESGIAEAAALRLCLHPEAEQELPALQPQLCRAASIALAIGPEGGWSPKDMESLEALGFLPLRFGPRILRTETAGPALLAAIQALRPTHT